MYTLGSGLVQMLNKIKIIFSAVVLPYYVVYHIDYVTFILQKRFSLYVKLYGIPNT